MPRRGQNKAQLSETGACGGADRRATVLLEHTTLDGVHYDWMLEDPAGGPEAQLITFRLSRPAQEWPARRRWGLIELGAHRRAYLSYEGPLSGQRGHVRRVAAGWYRPCRWSEGHIILRLELITCVATLELKRRGGKRWVGSVLQANTDQDRLF